MRAGEHTEGELLGPSHGSWSRACPHMCECCFKLGAEGVLLQLAIDRKAREVERNQFCYEAQEHSARQTPAAGL